MRNRGRSLCVPAHAVAHRAHRIPPPAFRGMGTRDPRVDAYIAKQADFAKPILARIRDVVHEACPEVQEDIKWGSPFFMYHGPMAHVPAFKEHVRFGFWKGKLVGGGDSADEEEM